MQCCFVTVFHPDADYWNTEAQASIQATITAHQARNTNTAKNVIMFLGDGMGVETVTAARILKGQQAGGSGEDAKLSPWRTSLTSGWPR